MEFGTSRVGPSLCKDRWGSEDSKEHEVVEDDLNNPELQEKLKSAKTVDELVALAREEGVELTDEMLDT